MNISELVNSWPASVLVPIQLRTNILFRHIPFFMMSWKEEALNKYAESKAIQLLLIRHRKRFVAGLTARLTTDRQTYTYKDKTRFFPNFRNALVFLISAVEHLQLLLLAFHHSSS